MRLAAPGVSSPSPRAPEPHLPAFASRLPARLLPWLAAVAVWAWLAEWLPDDLLHSDTTRDLLMARDCAQLGHCAAEGATTSLRGLKQGALWIDLLAVARRSGVSLGIVHHTLLALHGAVAGVTLSWLQRRTASAWRAIPVLLLASTLAARPVLWNPTLMLPMAVLATLALASWLEQPGTGRTLLATALLGLAIDTHPVAVVLITAAVAQAMARKRWLDAGLLALVPLLVTALLSPAAAFYDAWALVHAPWLLAGLAGLLVVQGLVAQRLAHWSTPMTAVACGTALGLATASLALGHGIEARYLAIALPPAALAMALELRPGRGWDTSIALGGLIGLVLLGQGHTELPWAYADARIVAQALDDAGIAWPLATLQVQGPGGRLLGAATAVWLPRQEGRPGAPPSHASVSVVPRAPRAPGWQPLGRGAMRTRLDRQDIASARLCLGATCQPLWPQDRSLDFADRSAPMLLPRDAPPGPFTVRLEVPVRPGPARWLQVQPRMQQTVSGCPWRFDPPAGPEGQVRRLTEDTRSVTLVTRIEAPCRDRFLKERTLPDLLETDPEDAWVRAAISP